MHELIKKILILKFKKIKLIISGILFKVNENNISGINKSKLNK